MTPDDAGGEALAGCLLVVMLLVAVVALTAYFGATRGLAAGALFLAACALAGAISALLAIVSGRLR